MKVEDEDLSHCLSGCEWVWLQVKVNLCTAEKKIHGTIKTYLKQSNKIEHKGFWKNHLKI